MYFNGVARDDDAGAGAILISLENDILLYSLALTQMYSNNMVEYQALNLAFRWQLEWESKTFYIYGDSQLVIN